MYIVTKKAERPRFPNSGECFYCQQKIGQLHKDDCVLIKKKVKVRMIVDYEIEVPAHWDKRQIEFHRNQGSWCFSNALDELAEYECICDFTKFELLEDSNIYCLDE